MWAHGGLGCTWCALSVGLSWRFCERAAYGLTAMITSAEGLLASNGSPRPCCLQTECKTRTAQCRVNQATGRDQEASSLEEGDVFGLISHRKLRCSFLARSYKSCVGVAPRQDRGLTPTMRVCAIKCNFVPLPPPAHQWMEGSVWWSQRSRGPSEFFKVRAAPSSPNCRCHHGGDRVGTGRPRKVFSTGGSGHWVPPPGSVHGKV